MLVCVTVERVIFTHALLSAASGYLNDLGFYDPAAGVWTALDGDAEQPEARESMGFVATPDGRLWVYGGRGGPSVTARPTR